MSKFNEKYNEIISEMTILENIKLVNQDFMKDEKSYKKYSSADKWQNALPNNISGIASNNGEFQKLLKLKPLDKVAYKLVDDKTYMIVGIYFSNADYGVINPHGTMVNMVK